MKIVMPDANNPKSFYLNPNDVNSVWFIFIPTHPEDNEVIYLMSVVFFKDTNDTIRVEPRYYSNFSEFLKNTELESVYNLLIKLIEESSNYSELQKQLINLQKQNFIVSEIRTPSDVDNPLELNDYSKCVLFSYEPRTLVNVQESVIENLINEIQKILPPDYDVK